MFAHQLESTHGLWFQLSCRN